MRMSIVVAAMVAVATTAFFYGSLRAQEARSVLDGVYTEEQAARGGEIYGQKCASCHGPALAGEDMAPGLTGGQFTSSWNDTTAGELAERIRISMPANNPGALSRQETVDVLAYIFRFNMYPVGKTELPRETEFLNQIKIKPPQP